VENGLYTIETDHKPLTALLASTELSQMPPRILRFRLREYTGVQFRRYTNEIKDVPGKHQIDDDTPSRAPASSLPVKEDEILIVKNVEIMAIKKVKSLPASINRLQ
jgi:hypothetical protein